MTEPATTITSHPSPPQAALAACDQLKSWLLDDAYDLWWERGADHIHGGFHERLSQDGAATGEGRRSRLHPRQIYSFAIADELGWDGPAEDAVRHALQYFLTHYRRADHFYRAVVAADGAVVKDEAVLYDQAFALLGLAHAYDLLSDDELRATARDLHDRLRASMSNAIACFEERSPQLLPLLSNSHMHLLEACMAWADLDHDDRWSRLVDEIVALALAKFIDPQSGVLREFFDEQWRPAAGEAGRIVEPGHQFEWAWLLLRWSVRNQDQRAQRVALRLIDIGEQYGVDRRHGAAVNSLFDDMSVRDGQARLWPQTERLKAACIAAEATGDAKYWAIATQSANCLMQYLDTPLRGLWRDRMNADGTFVDEPAPASSFYHIVCAIAEFEHTIRRTSGFVIAPA